MTPEEEIRQLRRDLKEQKRNGNKKGAILDALAAILGEDSPVNRLNWDELPDIARTRMDELQRFQAMTEVERDEVDLGRMPEDCWLQLRVCGAEEGTIDRLEVWAAEARETASFAVILRQMADDFESGMVHRVR